MQPVNFQGFGDSDETQPPESQSQPASGTITQMLNSTLDPQNMGDFIFSGAYNQNMNDGQGNQ